MDLASWVPRVREALAAAHAVDAMRTPATNPFTVALALLGDVVSTTERVRDSHLASISSTVREVNGLWHNNASSAFQVSAC
jgi:hypothetical protein